MNIHKNARLTPRGRERIVRQVESGQTPEAVAKAAGVCPRTRSKVDGPLSARRIGGIEGPLLPAASAAPADAAGGGHETIERLRRQRWTGKQIAVEAGVSPATVSRVLHGWA